MSDAGAASAPGDQGAAGDAGDKGGAASIGAVSDRSALRVAGLGKRFGKRIALSGVTIEAQAGEMVAVVGRNGAGKTTLLSIVAGVQEASEGTVSVSPGEVGWVPQQPAVYSKLSVAENLRLFATLEGVGDVEATVERMLAQTGLAERAGERVQRLSGGNRQRVNIALGLLSAPPVVVLDEPSTALDPTQRGRLWQFVSQLAKDGASVLFSTHIVDEAERYAGRVLVLDEGEQLFFGPPAELMATAGAPSGDFEAALVAFLAAAGRDSA